MQIRNPSPDDEPRPDEPAPPGPATPRHPAPDPRAIATPPDPTPPAELRFAVPAWVITLRAAGAALLAIAAVLAFDRTARTVGLLVAGVAAGFAVRDVVLRVRVRVDSDGATLVHGVRRHRLPWSDIERVTVDNRRQRGIRASLLEFDAGEAIFQYGRTELGADPYRALDAVAVLCPPTTTVDRPDDPYDDSD